MGFGTTDSSLGLQSRLDEEVRDRMDPWPILALEPKRPENAGRGKKLLKRIHSIYIYIYIYIDIIFIHLSIYSIYLFIYSSIYLFNQSFIHTISHLSHTYPLLSP